MSEKSKSYGNLIDACFTRGERRLPALLMPLSHLRQAVVQEQIASEVAVSYSRLKCRVGKEEAERLLAQFRSESFASLEVGHKYLIARMDAYSL